MPGHGHEILPGDLGAFTSRQQGTGTDIVRIKPQHRQANSLGFVELLSSQCSLPIRQQFGNMRVKLVTNRLQHHLTGERDAEATARFSSSIHGRKKGIANFGGLLCHLPLDISRAGRLFEPTRELSPFGHAASSEVNRLPVTPQRQWLAGQKRDTGGSLELRRVEHASVHLRHHSLADRSGLDRIRPTVNLHRATRPLCQDTQHLHIYTRADAVAMDRDPLIAQTREHGLQSLRINEFRCTHSITDKEHATRAGFLLECPRRLAQGR